MSDDLHDAIKRAAHHPRGPLDVTTLEVRMRRLQWRRRTLVGTAVLFASVATFAVLSRPFISGLVHIRSAPRGQPPVAAATPTVSAGEPSPRHTPTAEEYTVLARDADFVVLGPSSGQTFGWCPAEPLGIDEGDFSEASRAAVLGITTPAKATATMSKAFDEARPTDAAMATESPEYFQDAVARCGSLVQSRTIVVTVSFPNVTWSASLASASFYVSRLDEGWVVWDWPT